jgi:histidinol phosphatase-like enzyme
MKRYNKTYEFLADLFHGKYGRYAPGRDSYFVGPTSEEYRKETESMWKEFCEEYQMREKSVLIGVHINIDVNGDEWCGMGECWLYYDREGYTDGETHHYCGLCEGEIGTGLKENPSDNKIKRCAECVNAQTALAILVDRVSKERVKVKGE